jgi:predicted nucleotidyltransferase
VTGTNAVELLFGTYRRQILGLLLLHDAPLHVREIARLSGVPAGSLHRELRAMAEAGLLLRVRAGNQVHYRPNREHPIYPELAGIFRKTVGLADIVREALEPLKKQLRVAFIFGSIARGEETATSDVDVMLIGDVSLAQVVRVLAPLRERFGREVNPVVMARKDFIKKVGANDRFVSRILSEPKLFVIGGPDDLTESPANRAAQGASS